MNSRVLCAELLYGSTSLVHGLDACRTQCPGEMELRLFMPIHKKSKIFSSIHSFTYVTCFTDPLALFLGIIPLGPTHSSRSSNGNLSSNNVLLLHDNCCHQRGMSYSSTETSGVCHLSTVCERRNNNTSRLDIKT